MEDGSTAVNVVSETPEGELMLTFVFWWVHPGVEEGSEEAMELEKIHREVSRLCVCLGHYLILTGVKSRRGRWITWS